MNYLQIKLISLGPAKCNNNVALVEPICYNRNTSVIFVFIKLQNFLLFSSIVRPILRNESLNKQDFSDNKKLCFFIYIPLPVF